MATDWISESGPGFIGLVAVQLYRWETPAKSCDCVNTTVMAIFGTSRLIIARVFPKGVRTFFGD